ncbi:Mss4-like protein [Flammula alnicola]|nr:Mss4-like protein [Flammula alnicola]
MSLSYVKASCHCGLNAFQIPFLTSKLPQATNMCHCNTCRHITGELNVNVAIVEGTPLSADSGPEAHNPADLSHLTKYNASKELTRYFCSNCSAYMLEAKDDKPEPTWFVSTGTLGRTEGVVKVGHHIFVADTLDGGLADHFRVLEGVEIPRHTGTEDGPTLPVEWKAEKLLRNDEQHKEAGEDAERLEAYCHCKKISVYLTRAKQEEAKDPRKWWLVPGNDSDPTSRVRFMSGHCFCTSCRLTSGTTVQSWIILPRANVIDVRTSLPVAFYDSKNPDERSKRPHGLKQYQSSPGTFREFCDTCGASAFVIDLGAGLQDQEKGGARAEGWCFWYDKVIHPQDAVDRPGMEAVQAGVTAAATVPAPEA